MKQSASETRKRTSNDIKTNLSTFVGAGVCEESLLLFAEAKGEGTTLRASCPNVTDFAAVVAAFVTMGVVGGL